MWPKVTWPPSGFLWMCACATGSGAALLVTEGHVIPLKVSLGCSLRRPRPNGSNVTEVTSVTWTGSMFCACATGSCAMSALVGSFDRKWQSRVTGCDQRSLDPFGVPLCVRMRNRKLRHTSNDRRSGDPFGSVLGVFSTTSASYNQRKPPRPIFSMVTGTSPGYLPLLFSYSVYIGCVVLLLC